MKTITKIDVFGDRVEIVKGAKYYYIDRVVSHDSTNPHPYTVRTQISETIALSIKTKKDVVDYFHKAQ